MNVIDRSAVNRMLMSNGLGKLNDPGLIPQIGFLVSRCVNDHADFSKLIETCEPAQRNAMYEAMRPYLRFEAKPLDVYVAELGMLAEAKRLPTIDPINGQFVPFKVPEIKTLEERLPGNQRLPVVTEGSGPNPSQPPSSTISEERGQVRQKNELAIAQAAVEREFAKFHLTLLCKQCTREQTFCGVHKDDCVRLARAAGWRMRLAQKRVEAGEGALEETSALVETFTYELCPECAG